MHRESVFGIVAATMVLLSAPAQVGAADAWAGASRAKAPERLVLAQADGTPVSFSSDQADRGEDRFMRDCEECHGKDLKGGLNGGAPLRGLAFEQKYFDGLPASILFSYMSSAMPPNSPGRYSLNTYADLMAFILKRNGVRSGSELPADLDALDNVVMVK